MFSNVYFKCPHIIPNDFFFVFTPATLYLIDCNKTSFCFISYAGRTISKTIQFCLSTRTKYERAFQIIETFTFELVKGKIKVDRQPFKLSRFERSGKKLIQDVPILILMEINIHRVV